MTRRPPGAPGRVVALLAEFGRTGILTAPEEIVRQWLMWDWVRRDGLAVVMTEAGQAHLRRADAGEDGFRAQHQLHARGHGEARGAIVNHGESPLGWLRHRKDRNGNPLIGAEQFAAGERLRADHNFAHMAQRVTSRWDDSAPVRRGRRSADPGSAALSDDVIAAKDRVRRALEAVGPELSGVLLDICCELKGLEEAEREHDWPKRAGKIVLEIALTRLARHYGMLRQGNVTRKMRQWGAADYRPKI